MNPSLLTHINVSELTADTRTCLVADLLALFLFSSFGFYFTLSKRLMYYVYGAEKKITIKENMKNIKIILTNKSKTGSNNNPKIPQLI